MSSLRTRPRRQWSSILVYRQGLPISVIHESIPFSRTRLATLVAGSQAPMAEAMTSPRLLVSNSMMAPPLERVCCTAAERTKSSTSLCSGLVTMDSLTL